MNTITVPFTIPNLSQGLLQQNIDVIGIVGASSAGLTLEFQVKGSLFGVKSGIKNADILLDEIASIQYKKSLWGANILIKTKSLQSLEDVPGHENGSITLCIARKDRDAAEQFVQTIRLHLTEQDLQRLEAESRR